MILHRIVELQSHTVIRKITDNQAEYEFIEQLIESQKPPFTSSHHHYLIQTPFRYALPVPLAYASRFKVPFSERNCFYGAEYFQTSSYEYAYHWLQQRIHLNGLSQEPQLRTHFQVGFKDKQCQDIRRHPKIRKIMDRHDYGPSHDFMRKHPKTSSILYPSCRDPERKSCVVTFEIQSLDKKPRGERNLYFIYFESEKKCLIQDPFVEGQGLAISWREVN